MTRRPLRAARRWTSAYWATAATHLVAVACDLKPLRVLTKSALMPTLALSVRARQGPPLLVAALLASAVGDFLLELNLLLPAMAAFGAAHLCYVAVFSRGAQRRSWQIAAAYAVLYAAAMLALWPGLGLYRGPVAAYAVMLTATAVTSLWHGNRTGVGGALFLASDTLIAAHLAGHDFPLRAWLVRATYGAGQYQITKGLLRS